MLSRLGRCGKPMSKHFPTTFENANRLGRNDERRKLTSKRNDPNDCLFWKQALQCIVKIGPLDRDT